jgi:hypothetical protein
VQVGGRVNFTPAYDHQKMKPIAEQVTGGHMDPSRPSPGSSHGGGGMGGGAVGGGFAPPQQLYQQQQQQQQQQARGGMMPEQVQAQLLALQHQQVPFLNI